MVIHRYSPAGSVHRYIHGPSSKQAQASKMGRPGLTFIRWVRQPCTETKLAKPPRLKVRAIEDINTSLHYLRWYFIDISKRDPRTGPPVTNDSVPQASYLSSLPVCLSLKRDTARAPKALILHRSKSITFVPTPSVQKGRSRVPYDRITSRGEEKTKPSAKQEKSPHR